MAVEPPRTGTTEPFPDDLDPRVASALVGQGITALYRHQAEAWEALRAGGNAIVTTSTASGKSLAFNLPVLDLLAREPKSRALYLYPTKALAQDQARALSAFGVKGVKPAIYDGDTETRAPLADPQVGERDPDQPGHAPRRRAPAPRPLGRRALEPALRRRRRGARLSRRLRLARGECAPPPATARPRIRVGAAVRARVGDDREPRTAGRVAARRAGDRGRQRRCAGDRADDRALEPRADRRGARRPRERSRRRVAPARRPRRRGPADDLLREEPQGSRADPPLRVGPARAGAGRAPARRTAPATRRPSAARSSSA